MVIRAKAISEARPPAIPPASLPVPIPDTRTSVGNWRAKKEPEAASMAGMMMPVLRMSAAQMSLVVPVSRAQRNGSVLVLWRR